MSLIADIAQSYWTAGRKIKHTKKGWLSGNAVCCHHTGNSADTRGRGGMMIAPDGVSWHCFNCGYKCSWHEGSKLSEKFKKFLSWLDVPDEIITKCAFEALRSHDAATASEPPAILLPQFFETSLPKGSKLISEWIRDPQNIPPDLLNVLEYMSSRGLYVDDYLWFWTNETGYRNRLIIPFFYKGKIVGYTARLIKEGTPRYLSDQQSNYVFNLDSQDYERDYVFVTEGPIDAILIDGVSLMGSEVQGGQQMLINRLQKKVVVVPDRDPASIKLVERAIELGWSVSFPEWDDLKIKDINDAVKKYGRLATLFSIRSAIKTTPLKIQVAMKKWFRRTT